LEVKSNEDDVQGVFMPAVHHPFTISLQNIILTLDVVSNWHVTDETSLLDQICILLQVGDLEISMVIHHNPKRIILGGHQGKSRGCTKSVQSVQDVILADDLVQ
jgi:hypothetical protein